MKLLLTSAGMTNPSIHKTLVVERLLNLIYDPIIGGWRRRLGPPEKPGLCWPG